VIPGEITSADALAPPPVAPAPEPPPAVVRPGGEVQPPTKIHDATPGYPAIAQAARVQGVVIIEATIGVDGEVVGARVLRSVPLLDEAALQAVRQWRYTPTRLNGAPVAVIMTVTVNFQLR
jgi:protein TonB